MNEILKAERLSKTYGKSIAVSEVSLTVRQGDMAPERLSGRFRYLGKVLSSRYRWKRENAV